MKKQIKRGKSKRDKIKRIQIILILIISVILGTTLIISFNNYKKTTKKIEAKGIMRELILTIETIEVNESIEFDESDTIHDIKDEAGEKLSAITKYRNIEDFNKIEGLSLEDVRKIINNEVDFEINKEGQFLGIKLNN